jgi:hypothetical protein
MKGRQKRPSGEGIGKWENGRAIRRYRKWRDRRNAIAKASRKRNR